MADLAYRKANLEHAAASVTGLTQGTFLVSLLTLPLLAMPAPEITVLGVHPASVLLFVCYSFGLRLLAQVEDQPMWSPVRTRHTQDEEQQAEATGGDERETGTLWRVFLLYAAVTAGAGYAVGGKTLDMQQNTDLSPKSGETGGELADLPLEDLEARLGVTAEGLSGPDAAQRLQQYGYNELAEKTENPLLRFLSYFWGPIPWMIEAAAVLSLSLRDWADFVIIMLLLIANAVVGFWEEHQAGNAIAALKAKLALKARVKRDGAWEGPDGKTFQVAKCAPQVIQALAADAADIDQDVQQAVNEFAGRGFRSLGVARTDEEGRWRMLGVLPLYDPPRPDSKSTIATARQMGVRVKMVTGDQVAVAKEIASQLGLGTHIMNASVLSEAKHHEAGQLADTLESGDGVAQLFPEHKYHVVEVLQRRGHITGMTGDGVTDAPALKKADAGIAVSGATDAARAAADIVLLTPGLSIIVDAIKESRKTLQRMQSYSIYRIAETIRIVLFMTLSILVFDFYPLPRL